jgi:hypothetical protein
LNSPVDAELGLRRHSRRDDRPMRDPTSRQKRACTMQSDETPGIDPGDIDLLEKCANELSYLRQDHERRIGFVLAKLHHRLRQARKQQRADAVRGGAR